MKNDEMGALVIFNRIVRDETAGLINDYEKITRIKINVS